MDLQEVVVVVAATVAVVVAIVIVAEFDWKIPMQVMEYSYCYY